MKKLMAAFLAGALLIGVGLGITALEISRWDVVQHPYHLEKEELKTCIIEEEINTDDFETIECYVSQSMTSSAQSYKIIEVIEDTACTDTMKVEVDYCGREPGSYFWSYEGQDENGGKIYTLQYVVQPGYNNSLKAVREMVEQMFRDKIFYTENAATLIEAVRIYTAAPDKIQKIH